MDNKKDIEKVEGIKESVSYYYDDILYLDHLKQRKIIINTEIDDCLIEDAVLRIMQWNQEDKGLDVENRKPVTIYLNSPGGMVTAGFALIDTIINSKTPVYTVNLGIEYSMGFLIGIAGHKRYTQSFATFLLHDGSGFLYNSMSKIRDTAIFYEELENKIKNFILSHSTLSPKLYDKKYGSEWYMFAEEAKANGFTDYIIGVDCDLDEII